MDYDDEQIEEKSFKISGNDDPDELFHDDTEDPLGIGPDEDFNPNGAEDPEEEFSERDNY